MVLAIDKLKEFIQNTFDFSDERAEEFANVLIECVIEEAEELFDHRLDNLQDDIDRIIDRLDNHNL